MKILTFFIFLTIFGLSLGSLGKLQPCLLKALKTKSHVDILVQFESTDQVLKKIENTDFENNDEKTESLVEALKIHSETCQKSTLEFLKSRKSRAELKTLMISNILWVQSAELSLIREIASKSEVFEIFEDGRVTLDDPIIPPNQSLLEIEQSPPIGWGVTKIKAPDAWTTYPGINGTGIRVGIIDTGVYGNHTFLKRKFVDGGWYDPYYGTPFPDDQHGHGTHCAGTVLGSSVDETNISGPAPGANWVACRGLDNSGSGSYSNLINCFNFLLKLDSTKIPHVVSNSWGGSGTSNFFDSVLKAMETANIFVVFANGNSGPSCNTVGFPANTNNPLTAVGATDSSDNLANFSSRGPVTSGPQVASKPDVSAPGVSIVSCGRSGPTSMVTMSGTSMATPHVAGVVAMIRQQHPDYTNTAIRNLLYGTCDQPTITGTSCNPDASWPNSDYGSGRINALKALGVAP